MKCYTGKTAPIDMLGKTFTHLTVVSEVERDKRGLRMFLCRCVCGKQKAIMGSSLRSGSTKSCCYYERKDHGMWKTREFKIWNSMIDRCRNPKNKYFKKGIKVCDRWTESFKNFFADMGLSKGLTIDRINTYGNYEPSNCRWATPKVQQCNRTINRVIEYNGVSKCASEWIEELNMPNSTFYNRIKRGWDMNKIINTPVMNTGKKFLKEAE